MSNNLPPNWEAKWSAQHNRYYYVNHATKATQWQKPEPAVTMSSFSSNTTNTSSLPPNWEAKWSAQHNRYYYVNHVTKLTQWQKPESSQVRFQANGQPEAHTQVESEADKIAKSFDNFNEKIKIHYNQSVLANMEGFNYDLIIDLIKDDSNDFANLYKKAESNEIESGDIVEAKNLFDEFIAQFADDKDREKAEEQSEKLREIYLSFGDGSGSGEIAKYFQTSSSGSAKEIITFNSVAYKLIRPQFTRIETGQPLDDYELRNTITAFRKGIEESKEKYEKEEIIRVQNAEREAKKVAEKRAREAVEKEQKSRENSARQLRELEEAYTNCLSSSAGKDIPKNQKLPFKSICNTIKSNDIAKLQLGQEISSSDFETAKFLLISSVEFQNNSAKETKQKKFQNEELVRIYVANFEKASSYADITELEEFLKSRGERKFLGKMDRVLDASDLKNAKKELVDIIKSYKISTASEPVLKKPPAAKPSTNLKSNTAKPKVIVEKKEKTKKTKKVQKAQKIPIAKKVRPPKNTDFLTIEKYGQAERVQPKGSRGAVGAKIGQQGSRGAVGPRIVPMGPMVLPVR